MSIVRATSGPQMFMQIYIVVNFNLRNVFYPLNIITSTMLAKIIDIFATIKMINYLLNSLRSTMTALKSGG